MERTNDKEASRQLCERAYRLFDEFRSAYRQEWLRLENNERIYRGDHWYDVPVTDEHEPRPVTPIIQSTVENVSADLMDQVPEVFIEPQDGVGMVMPTPRKERLASDRIVPPTLLIIITRFGDMMLGSMCLTMMNMLPAPCIWAAFT